MVQRVGVEHDKESKPGFLLRWLGVMFLFLLIIGGFSLTILTSISAAEWSLEPFRAVFTDKMVLAGMRAGAVAIMALSAFIAAVDHAYE